MVRKIIPAILIIILLLFIRSRIATLKELKKTGNSVEEVQEQLENEKNQQALLTQQLTFVKSNEYIEEQAREKLNLTKKGEIIVIHTSQNEEKNREDTPNEKKQVWEKWVEKLF